MKFGCGTTPEHYPVLAELGFDYIELMGRTLVSLDDGQFSGLKRRILSGPLPCPALNAYCPPSIIIAGPGYDREAARRYAALCARRAGEIGVRTVGIGSPFSRTLPEGYPRQRAWEETIDFFRVTAEEFAPFGITVCIEALGTCFCNFINTLEEAVSLVKRAESENLGVYLDFYNMEHNGEADIDLAFAYPYIAHAHVSDDDGQPTRRYFFKPEKAAEHQKRLARLMALGYDGNVSIEIDLPVDPALAAQSLAILKAVNGPQAHGDK